MNQGNHPWSPGQGAQAVHTGRDGREYSSFAGGIDLIAAGPHGNPARQFIVLAAAEGSIIEVVTQQGTTRTFSAPFWVGIWNPLAIRSITANTTAALVAVTW